MKTITKNVARRLQRGQKLTSLRMYKETSKGRVPVQCVVLDTINHTGGWDAWYVPCAITGPFGSIVDRFTIHGANGSQWAL